jgi:hypothetical protein
MKFLCIYQSDPAAPPPTPEKLGALGKYTADMIASGTVVMTGGIVRPSKGIDVRLSAGKFTVTDGPFPETKELIDGFAIVEAKSREEAVELSRSFMQIAGEGQGQILRIFEPSDFPH